MSRNDCYQKKITLKSDFDDHLLFICGPADCNIDLLETAFGVKIDYRDRCFICKGADESSVNTTIAVLEEIRLKTLYGDVLKDKDLQMMLNEQNKCKNSENSSLNPVNHLNINLGKNIVVYPRSKNQLFYINSVFKYDIVFGVGPAGTGKTFLAVALALWYLERSKVSKIILVRPVIEAGEKLGFLPGTFEEKIDPYLQPIFDALKYILGSGKSTQLLNEKIVDIVPLAYMRGRTMENAFIILDEAQNATKEQIKMFLTRMGNGSKIFVNGDLMQIDLPNVKQSGLADAVALLSTIDGIGSIVFDASDVVRNPLVKSIIRAYIQQDNSGRNK
jgi:phosphate starvation-inducible protein PhoH and related proteins